MKNAEYAMIYKFKKNIQMPLFYYAAKCLSERLLSDEFHRPGITDFAGYALTFIRCLVSSVRFLLNTNK